MRMGTYDVDVDREFEDNTTEYTLLIYSLPHRIFSRSSKYAELEKGDLDPKKMKTVKLLSRDFPSEMRCQHVRNAPMCDKGCYVREKGGGSLHRICGRGKDCDGHAYSGQVAMNNKSVACFGKKGKRMVCIDPENKWITDGK
jgi:hypothetical protein